MLKPRTKVLLLITLLLLVILMVVTKFRSLEDANTRAGIVQSSKQPLHSENTQQYQKGGDGDPLQFGAGSRGHHSTTLYLVLGILGAVGVFRMYY